mmetsp:Transcript_44272/g.65684  ORF Transcript_44272/g.65684 Transcript_44272/m.65684 type:complete len:122 (-) Transcript_44272:67-432(-)
MSLLREDGPLKFVVFRLERWGMRVSAFVVKDSFQDAGILRHLHPTQLQRQNRQPAQTVPRDNGSGEVTACLATISLCGGPLTSSTFAPDRMREIFVREHAKNVKSPGCCTTLQDRRHTHSH